MAGGVFRVEEEPTGRPDPILGAGRSRRFVLTDPGRSKLGELGVDVETHGRRPLTRSCLDWTEQRPHLAGALGASLLCRFGEPGWLTRGERRVVRVTDVGRKGLVDRMGVDPGAFD